MSRNVQALSGIGLAISSIVLTPSLASAQQYNRAPDPNAARVMVGVFKSSEKGLGVSAADAVRSRVSSELPFKEVYALPKQDINTTLEASGFSTTEALQSHDSRALANILRADEYITGNAIKAGANYKIDANLVLARDNALVQPLGTYENPKVDGSAAAIVKELKEARKQIPFEKKCVNFARDSKYDQAIAAAKEGIVAYPKATLARICWANVLVSQKAPDAEIVKVAKEIVGIDAYSRPGLALLANAYRTMNLPDSAVLTLTRLLATDPSNPRLQKDVVDAIASLKNPALARPVIDSAVAMNPGDPELLSLRWKILLAVKDNKAALAQGEELVKLDTAFADTTYFIRTAAVLYADSQFQKSAEFAATGLKKFAAQPSLTYQQIIGLRSAGQGQQALDALNKANDAKIPIENGNFLKFTLLKELNRTSEILPAAKAMIAAGDTTTIIRQNIVQIGKSMGDSAVKSKSVDEFLAAIAVLQYADSVSKGTVKQQAGFLIGSDYVQISNLKYQQAVAQKSCPLAKEAKAFAVDAQIQLPKGGAFAPDAMRQLMGSATQLDAGADQVIKAYCK